MLLFATILFSPGCKTENEVAKPVVEYPKFSDPKLPDGIVRVTGHHVDSLVVVETHGPGLAERTLAELIAGGATLVESSPDMWKVKLSESQQMVSPRGRDGICLSGFDYFIISGATCSSANVWKFWVIYNQGQYATAKFITLEHPWLKWGECGETSCDLVQAGLDGFAELIIDALFEIGVPDGFQVCISPVAYDNPNGNHVYVIEVNLTNVPAGVLASFSNIWTVNCTGTGYATPPVNLTQDLSCILPPCLAGGPN